MFLLFYFLQPKNYSPRTQALFDVDELEFGIENEDSDAANAKNAHQVSSSSN